MIVLKLDGEIWECAEGWSEDFAKSITGIKPIDHNSKYASDQNALRKGITHVQGFCIGIPCHEIRKLGEVGDGQIFKRIDAKE